MADYEIKNGWILCKILVVDRKELEMGFGKNEWARFAIKISVIGNFRECDDEDLEGCSVLDFQHGEFTITVPFDDLVRLCVKENKFVSA